MAAPGLRKGGGTVSERIRSQSPRRVLQCRCGRPSV